MPSSWDAVAWSYMHDRVWRLRVGVQTLNLRFQLRTIETRKMTQYALSGTIVDKTSNRRPIGLSTRVAIPALRTVLVAT